MYASTTINTISPTRAGFAFYDNRIGRKLWISAITKAQVSAELVSEIFDVSMPTNDLSSVSSH